MIYLHKLMLLFGLDLNVSAQTECFARISAKAPMYQGKRVFSQRMT